MGFLAEKFPLDPIAYGSSRTPRWRTSIVKLASGAEKRNQEWVDPLYSYDVTSGVRDEIDLDDLVTFFNVVGGRRDGFLFTDPQDNLAADDDFGTGDASETEFQLARLYIVGATEYRRKISKPVSGTVVIRIDNVVKTEGVDYTIDYTTGLVTFTSAPGSGLALTWDGDFDIPVRFDQDRIEDRFEEYQLNSARVRVVEIRI